MAVCTQILKIRRVIVVVISVDMISIDLTGMFCDKTTENANRSFEGTVLQLTARWASLTEYLPSFFVTPLAVTQVSTETTSLRC